MKSDHAESEAGGYREAYAAARAELVEVRKQRQELAYRCERLEAALAAASDGVWDFDVLRGRVHYSPGWARMLGREPDDLDEEVEQALSLIHPEDRSRVEAAFERHLAGGCAEAYRVVFRLRHRDGRWVSVLSRGAVVRDHRGEAVRFIGTHVDLSTCAAATGGGAGGAAAAA